MHPKAVYDTRDESVKIKLYQYADLILLMTGAGVLMCLVVVTALKNDTMFNILYVSVLILCLVYLGIYLKDLRRNKRHIPYRVWIEDNTFYAQSLDGTKHMNLDDLKILVGYSSRTNAALGLISEKDYIVITLGAGNAMFKEGKERMRAFYSIGDCCVKKAPHFEKIIRSRKANQKSKIRIPSRVFEMDISSPEAQKVIEEIRAYDFST